MSLIEAQNVIEDRSLYIVTYTCLPESKLGLLPLHYTTHLAEQHLKLWLQDLSFESRPKGSPVPNSPFLNPLWSQGYEKLGINLLGYTENGQFR